MSSPKANDQHSRFFVRTRNSFTVGEPVFVRQGQAMIFAHVIKNRSAEHGMIWVKWLVTGKSQQVPITDVDHINVTSLDASAGLRNEIASQVPSSTRSSRNVIDTPPQSISSSLHTPIVSMKEAKRAIHSGFSKKGKMEHGPAVTTSLPLAEYSTIGKNSKTLPSEIKSYNSTSSDQNKICTISIRDSKVDDDYHYRKPPSLTKCNTISTISLLDSDDDENVSDVLKSCNNDDTEPRSPDRKRFSVKQESDDYDDVLPSVTRSNDYSNITTTIENSSNPKRSLKSEKDIDPMNFRSGKNNIKKAKMKLENVDSVIEEETEPAIHNTERHSMSKWQQLVEVKKEEIEESYRLAKIKSEDRPISDMRKKWIASNIDPLTGKGRKTFRRGCHSACISTLLGGQGTHPAPVVRNAPNPKYVKPGEMYMAGNCDWNPYNPRFSGDKGLANAHFFYQDGYDWRKQESFHLFISCSKNPFDLHYNGPEAKGKYVYLGRYRRVPDDDFEWINEPFSALSEDSKWKIAGYHRRRSDTIRWENPENCQLIEACSESITEQHRQEAKELDSEKWDSWNSEKRDTAAWIIMLEDKKYTIRTVPIEFVSYDEDLYRALLNIQADNGRVSLDQIGPC